MYISSIELLFSKASRHKDTYRLAELLGLDYDVWRRQVIEVAYASQYVSTLLPDAPEMHSTGDLLEHQNILLANGSGVAMIIPPRVENTLWPTEPVIRLTYGGNLGTLKLAYGSWGYSAKCRDVGGRLEVEWPDDLGVNGDLALDEPYGPGFEAELPTYPTIPVRYVADSIMGDKEAYRELERAGYLEAFYQTARPDERVAIAMAAVYKILTH